MDKIKKTYRDISQFVAIASQWREENKKQSKLSYAIMRVLKKCQKLMDDFQDQITEISTRHASVDKDSILLTEQDGRFRYTREALTKRNQEQRELNDKEVEVEIYIATNVPSLTAVQMSAFEGFVIPEMTEPPDEK